jgi:dTMP kinase
MSTTQRGRFIVVEGIDGSGKSTQVSTLVRRLEDAGVPVHVTAEPTTGPIGVLIRQAFSGRIPLDDRVIAALFVADRIDHLTNDRDGLLALLDSGVTVISDRYHLSSAAYHSGDTGMDWVLAANSVATDLLRADLTVYLDLSPEAALRRLQARREATDKFEVIERLTVAHDGYEQVIARVQDVERVERVDADRDADAVADDVERLVRGVLGV